MTGRIVPGSYRPRVGFVLACDRFYTESSRSPVMSATNRFRLSCRPRVDWSRSFRPRVFLVPGRFGPGSFLSSLFKLPYLECLQANVYLVGTNDRGGEVISENNYRYPYPIYQSSDTESIIFSSSSTRLCLCNLSSC